MAQIEIKSRLFSRGNRGPVTSYAASGYWCYLDHWDQMRLNEASKYLSPRGGWAAMSSFSELIAGMQKQERISAVLPVKISCINRPSPTLHACTRDISSKSASLMKLP